MCNNLSLSVGHLYSIRIPFYSPHDFQIPINGSQVPFKNLFCMTIAVTPTDSLNLTTVVNIDCVLCRPLPSLYYWNGPNVTTMQAAPDGCKITFKGKNKHISKNKFRQTVRDTRNIL